MAYLDPQEGAARETRQVAAVADIPDPATASATDVANKINELLAALRAAGTLAS